MAQKRLITLAASFRCVGVVGPRQSGKTTLCKSTFLDKPYVSLEDPDEWIYALQDPRGFLDSYKDGAILDEVHRVPILFSYLQQILDTAKKPGLFILTGSNHFLMQENISQTLAGRIAYLNLLPLSFEELNNYATLKTNSSYYIYKGFYPELYQRKIQSYDWMLNYINTFVERDLRQLKNINNLRLFSRFLKICATRIGQIINMTSLGNDCGIDQKTVMSWLSILESSFVIYLLKPYYNNYGKRIIKSPKLYFYDTGLAANLLGIENELQVTTNSLYGNLFENLIIAEFLKQNANEGKRDNFFFWRDQTGNEIDLIQETAVGLNIIEIKAAQTYSTDFAKHLLYFEKLLKKPLNKFIIYNGKTTLNRPDGIQIRSWNELLKF